MSTSESPEYFKISIPATDDYDQEPARLEVSHSPEEDEGEVGLGLYAGTRFEGVHLTEAAAEQLRDALTGALDYLRAHRSS